MFTTPRQESRKHTRGVRFTDTELKAVRKLLGKRTFSVYVRDLIAQDYRQRSKTR